MKVTFEGPTIIDVVQQAHFFSVAFKGETPVSKPSPVTHLNGEKRKPGRPPNPNSKKGIAIRLEENQPASDTLMVGAAGIEPVSASPDTGSSYIEPVSPHHSVKISKEDLIAQLNAIIGKSGVQAAREILEKFGINRLGELDEKRYHELHKVLEGQLAL